MKVTGWALVAIVVTGTFAFQWTRFDILWVLVVMAFGVALSLFSQADKNRQVDFSWTFLALTVLAQLGGEVIVRYMALSITDSLPFWILAKVIIFVLAGMFAFLAYMHSSDDTK